MNTSPDLIKSILDDNRRELLDLSSRNRLISTPIGSKTARLIQIFDEKSDEVFKRLIIDKKPFIFSAGIEKKKETIKDDIKLLDNDLEELADLPLPDDDEIDTETGKAKRYTDNKLQTRLSAEVLQRRLFDLYNESKVIIEEQGVNILYLAVGMIRWVDKSNNSERYAPLILIPVDLLRKSASEKFSIKWREEDLQENLSLREKFDIEFGLKLPILNLDDPESFDIFNYFEEVRQTISPMSGWRLEIDNICLGFFSFAKFLMYRDLDATVWPDGYNILNHSLINKLLLTRHENTDFQLFESVWSDNEKLDDRIPTERLDHVVDADSSQTVAIEMVREGRNMVIQGPPGTGKSQTITNIIANAVLDGKKVLFLAEKLAALEVVKRRLEKEGLGVLCLELHSNKAKKASVAFDLKNTWDLGKPKSDFSPEFNTKLEQQRRELNDFTQQLHKPLEPIAHSAFDHISVISKFGRPTNKEIDIHFEGAESWSKEQLEQYRVNLRELQIRYKAIGKFDAHIWRGVKSQEYNGTQRQRYQAKLENWIELITLINEEINAIQDLTKLKSEYITLNLSIHLEELLKFVIQKPEVEIHNFSSSVWKHNTTALSKLIDKKITYETIREELFSVVHECIWKSDIAAIRQEFILHGKKWYNFLISSFKNAKILFNADLKEPLNNNYDATINLIDKIYEGQQAYQYLIKEADIGKAVFGNQWGKERNGRLLYDTLVWTDNIIGSGFADEEIHAAMAMDKSHAIRISSDLQNMLIKEKETRSFIEDALQINWEESEIQKDILLVDLKYLGGWLKRCVTSIDLLPDWIYLQKQLHLCKRSVLNPLVALLEEGYIEVSSLVEKFESLFAMQMLGQVFSQDKVLSDFNGDGHKEKINIFRHNDFERLKFAKLKVLDAHYTNIPEKRNVGMVGTVLGESNKQRNHKPIRKLLKEAGSVIQQLKPVFMMSPLSVAQFLEPGAVEFDLLVIDEASQVQPVDALGAVARSKQIIVVGDDKQLPPTMFFSKMTSNTDDDDQPEEEGQVKAKELESILSLCKARGIADTMLRWHYRSKHQSLIAVSNRRYYDNKLFIVPSPWTANSGMGLVWRFINGIYDRANTRANSIEAKSVANAVLEHAKKYPNLTLGVAAFSMPQQRAIQDEVELMRRKYPLEMETFFNSHSNEPFFVKNLENVQGDERDVIFLSVGYGKDVEGRMFQNFGPLNKEGGQRRLNVLISRARRRCEVFSSITEQDIDTGKENVKEGVKGLKAFLYFARTGQMEVIESANLRDMDSYFEEAVKNTLEQHFPDWEIHTQVGVSGFFVDLAILDSERKGRYILGIECDGVAYHSSPSARERDRLRQSILESQGWIIHRLWSIDFFRKPEQEIYKIKNAYDEALMRLKEEDALELIASEEEKNIFHLVRELEDKPGFVSPYIAARNIPLPSDDPYALYASQISSIIYEILLIESPIHKDELVTRMREQWGWARAASRFRNHVEEGLQILTSQKKIIIEDNIILLNDQPINTVRRRDENSPIGTRKPIYLPKHEIKFALHKITESAIKLTRDEASREVSRAFGFKSLSNDFKQIIEIQINSLVKENVLKEEDGKVSI